VNAHVEGLQRGDVAYVQVIPGDAETVASLAARGITLPRRKTGNGQWTIDVGSLPDGAYALQIQAPSPYFREPKEYAFRVKQAQIVDGQDVVFRFHLMPPSAQRRPPCREPGPGVWPPGLSLACQAERMVTVPVPPPPPPQFPPPRGSVIEGQITGVAEDTRVTIQVRRLMGEPYVQQPRWGSGGWRTIVLQPPGEVVEYVVTAEATGYVSEPPNYTLRVQDQTAALVDAGHATAFEVHHLDFQFRPVPTPPVQPR
jgi:hypothetical protein